MSMIIPDPRFEMPELFEPGRRSLGPVQLSLPNHLQSALVAAWLFQRGLTDRPYGRYSTRPIVSSAVGYSPYSGAVFTSAGGLIVESSGAELALPSFTLVAFGKFPTPGAVSAVYSRMANGTTANADSHLTLLTSRQLRFYGAIPSNITIDSTDSYTANEYASLAWLRRGGNSGTFAINGKLDSGGWQTCSGYNSVSIRTVIGANASNLSQQVTGDLSHMLLFGSELTEVELTALHYSINQYLIPA